MEKIAITRVTVFSAVCLYIAHKQKTVFSHVVNLFPSDQ